MSEKHFCDGCDTEVFLPGEVRNLKVTLWGKDSAFDLCTSCMNRMSVEHLPPRWPRAPLPDSGDRKVEE